jgi:hypothetical protein
MIDLRVYFSVLAVLIAVCILGLIGQCQYKEQQENEERLTEITPEQKREVMSWTGYEEAQHLELADRMLTGRVEKDWRETK